MDRHAATGSGTTQGPTKASAARRNRATCRPAQTHRAKPLPKSVTLPRHVLQARASGRLPAEGSRGGPRVGYVDPMLTRATNTRANTRATNTRATALVTRGQ